LPLGCLLLCSCATFASLGGDESSVQSDAGRMQARSLKTTRSGAFSFHEIQTTAGTAVREYVSPAGIVFAVAWKGPWRPDLQQLLGAHFAEYQTAIQDPNRRPAHGPTTIQVQNLVVQLSGHMRDYSGRAYLTDQLPAAVDLETIH